MFALMPLAILGALILVLQRYGPGKALRTSFPPVEDIAFKRIVLQGDDNARPKEIVVSVVNNGPSATTVAQVTVDEAYWPFVITPKNTLKRLESAEIRLRYPWVDGETHEVKLVTSTGLTFAKEIAVAVPSPRPTWGYLGIFSLLGLYVGVIPVFLGLLWFPSLRTLSASRLNFLLSLTVGLLVFLVIDAVHEALEIADELPGAFDGTALLSAGIGGSLLLLMTVSRRSRAGSAQERIVLATMIALGIGLHNLGEGLAIGSAYAVGNIALGGLLVVGFAIHNTTEGLAIVAPVAKDRVTFMRLVGMGTLAGAPTILGAWLGAFTYSAVWSVLFLGIGAGAIAQVVYAILRQMNRQSPDTGLLTVGNLAGLATGFAGMYATGLLVAF
jgi:zinc transporter ZupT